MTPAGPPASRLDTTGPGRARGERGRARSEGGKVRTGCGRLSREYGLPTCVSGRSARYADGTAANRDVPHLVRAHAQRARPSRHAMRPGSQAKRLCGYTAWTLFQSYRPTAHSFRPARSCSDRSDGRSCPVRICSGPSQCHCGRCRNACGQPRGIIDCAGSTLNGPPARPPVRLSACPPPRLAHLMRKRVPSRGRAAQRGEFSRESDAPRG